MALIFLSITVVYIGPFRVCKPASTKIPMPILIEREYLLFNNTEQIEIPSSSRSSRWWAGTISSPFYLSYVEKISVIIKIPDEKPQDDYWYWIGISCWDNNNSYDQIGFNSWGSSSNRYWTICYSSTYWVDGELKFRVNNDAGKLSPGTTYKFSMIMWSWPWIDLVYFDVAYKYFGNWISYKTYSEATGGTKFVVTYGVWTGYGWYCSFTNWEESFPDFPAPPDDFKFEETKIDDVYFPNFWWWEFKSGPVPSGIDIEVGEESGKPYVLVDNP